MRAAREREREEHAQQRADERRADQPEARDGAGGRHADDVPAERRRGEHQHDTQHGAGGRAQEVRVGQRVAKQALGRGARKAEQRAGQPGAQRSRGTDLEHDEPPVRVGERAEEPCGRPAVTAGGHPGGGDDHAPHRQAERQPEAPLAVGGHRALGGGRCAKHSASAAAASPIRGPRCTRSS
jgi:hypothetical protein